MPINTISPSSGKIESGLGLVVVLSFVSMPITVQFVCCRILDSVNVLPASYAGTGTLNTSNPSATISKSLRCIRLNSALAPIDAYDITRSAPARCKAATLRSNVAREIICISSRNSRLKMAREMLVSLDRRLDQKSLAV